MTSRGSLACVLWALVLGGALALVAVKATSLLLGAVAPLGGGL